MGIFSLVSPLGVTVVRFARQIDNADSVALLSTFRAGLQRGGQYQLQTRVICGLPINREQSPGHDVLFIGVPDAELALA
jgi:hypothetical protein